MSGAVKTHSALNRDQVAEVSFIVRATDKNAEDPPLQIGSGEILLLQCSHVIHRAKMGHL